MRIICIFEKCLYAIQYTGSPENEFRRLFNLWHNPEKLLSFFEKNKKDLQNGNNGTFSVSDAVIKTIDFAIEMEKSFMELSNKKIKSRNKSLDELFQPLHDRDEGVGELNKRKAKQNWLRIYALRIGENVFIITGGAIKLTQKMSERKHTKIELQKLESSRRYLIRKHIIDQKDIIEEIEF